MDWYWNLSDLLLDKNRVEKSSAGLRDELEKHVDDLYRKLIAYQMRSVYSYYRNRGVVFFRDMIKLDDWDGQLKGVTDAEKTVRTDSDQYNTQQIRSHLYDLVSTTRSEELKLQNIYSAIQYQTKQQKEVHQDEQDKEFRKDLFTTDPRDDKDRIEQTKGGLLKDSYRWILENPDFRKWREDPQSRMLWVKGDPGKGKTMLICGIIDELKKLSAGNSMLSFFFCQATDLRINNATAVLRGLVHLLILQQPSLISHVRKNYDYADKRLFEGPNAYVVLSRIFTNILCDPELRPTYLIIDALDECVSDLQRLLDLVVQEVSASARVKWIVSSRNWPVIEGRLRLAGQKAQLSLELNKDSIAAAIEIYIQQKVLALGQLMNYDETTRNVIKDYLSLNAKGTFLWVALVCENLKKMENISSWKTLKALKAFPPGLDSLYGRMKDQIFEMADDDDVDLCKQILAVATTVYQPVTLHELRCLIKLPEHDTSDDVVSLKQVIGLCGSFLTIRDDTIYFVHQSAKDYLIEKASSAIFPCGPEDVHHSIFSRSLQAMSMPETLRRNIYALPWLGFPIANINRPNPDPLAAVRYSCVYWVNHLCDGHTPSSSHRGDLDDGGPVSVFLQKHFLHWLEALSLFRSMSEGVVSIRRLESLFSVSII